jgi:hypothetical protein
MNKEVLAILLLVFASLSYATLDVGTSSNNLNVVEMVLPSPEGTNYTLVNTNSSNYWDALDTPADILGSLINNDEGWASDQDLSGYLLNTGDTATGDYSFDGTTLHIDSVNNRVGIGTTSPHDKLEVAGSGHSILISDSGDSYNERVRMGATPGYGGYLYLKDNSEALTMLLRSYAVSGVQAYFTAGNVGIGTTTPKEKLVVVGNVNITGNFSGNQFYANACYHNDSGTVLTFSDGIFYNMTFDGFDLNGFSSSSDRITTLVAGKYMVNYVSVGSGQNNHVYISQIAVNNVGKDCTHSHKKMASGGDVTPMPGVGIIDLNVGDVVQIQVADSGASGDGIYYGSSMNLIRIGD